MTRAQGFVTRTNSDFVYYKGKRYQIKSKAKFFFQQLKIRLQKCSRINRTLANKWVVRYKALSVMACVQAPSGTLDITGSDPPDNNDSTVRS